MSEKRFTLRGGFIEDNLTGFTYRKLNEICKLLNQVNDRADKNAEKLDTFIFKKEQMGSGSVTYNSGKYEVW